MNLPSLGDQVVVTETENDREILVTLHVAQDDMGKVMFLKYFTLVTFTFIYSFPVSITASFK